MSTRARNKTAPKIKVNVKLNNKGKNNKRPRRVRRIMTYGSNGPALKAIARAVSKAANVKRPVRVLTGNPTSWRRSGDSLFEKQDAFARLSKLQYIHSLVFPEVAANNHYLVKAPTMVPVPTTSWSFKEVFTMKPNEAGNAVIIWHPNFFADFYGLENAIHNYGTINGNGGVWPGFARSAFANITYANDNSITGVAVSENAQWHNVPFTPSLINFNKYRLVSALCRVSYTGKSINKSGVLLACATYDDIPRIVKFQNTAIEDWVHNSSILNHYTDFDYVNNGLWARKVNINANPDGIEVLFVPTDPLNQVFVENGCVAGLSNIKVNIGQGNQFADASYAYNSTNISYVFAANGVSSESAGVLRVETYYNFEVIVENKMQPYFATSQSQPYTSAEENILKSVHNKISSTFAIRPATAVSRAQARTTLKSLFEKAIPVFKTAAGYVNKGAKLYSLIKAITAAAKPI